MISRSDALLTDLQTDLNFPVKGEAWAPDATYREVAAQQLVDSFYKKFVESVSPQADDRALDKFIAVNERCGNWRPECETWEEELVGTLKQVIYEFWNPLGLPLVSTFDEVLDFGRVGPGSSVGAYGNDFYTKIFSSPLTSTSALLYDVYRRYVAFFPRWSSAESFRLSQYGEAHVVAGSRFHFVPKNDEISRLICSEPSLNMFFQLGFGARLEQRLSWFFGIKLDRQQDVNRELARIGSLDEGLHDSTCPSTIDLSSASDSMSLRMAESLFPADLVSWLKLFRCPLGEVDGKQVTLNMVSTMGNGFTFPLQTMLFACIVSASARYRGLALKRAIYEDNELVSPGNWSVFGDDIICPRSITRDVLLLLKYCGFQVNEEKTFVEGPFRESCGRDYYCGRDVRGVYVKSLSSQQDRYVIINLLNRWTAKTGISLPLTVGHLLRSVRFTPIPFFENDDAGIKVPSDFVPSIRRCKRTGSVKYARYLPKQKYIRVLEGSLLCPSVMAKRSKVVFNPDGLFMAFLRGDVVSYKIGVRHDTVSYSAKWGVTPYWDYVPPTGPVGKLVPDWGRWKTAIYLNMY